jgi:RNA polymerase sigma-70 factor (ECF subfamily)
MSSYEVLETGLQAEQLHWRTGSRPKAPSLSSGQREAHELRRGSVESSGDGELIRRIGERDHEAFEALYRRFAWPVLGLALRRLRDRGRAEDAAQETFTAIWRSAATYRPERAPAAHWLYAVARNAIINQTRTPVEPATEALESPSEGPGPPEQVESEWVNWRMHRAVEELPEHQRMLIELAYRSELSQSEIATRLNIPLGTVKARTRSALARLAKRLEHEELQ